MLLDFFKLNQLRLFERFLGYKLKLDQKSDGIFAVNDPKSPYFDSSFDEFSFEIPEFSL